MSGAIILTSPNLEALVDGGDMGVSLASGDGSN